MNSKIELVNKIKYQYALLGYQIDESEEAFYFNKSHEELTYLFLVLSGIRKGSDVND
jgi:hypothetical protein